MGVQLYRLEEIIVELSFEFYKSQRRGDLWEILFKFKVLRSRRFCVCEDREKVGLWYYGKGKWQELVRRVRRNQILWGLWVLGLSQMRSRRGRFSREGLCCNLILNFVVVCRVDFIGVRIGLGRCQGILMQFRQRVQWFR